MFSYETISRSSTFTRYLLAYLMVGMHQVALAQTAVVNKPDSTIAADWKQPDFLLLRQWYSLAPALWPQADLSPGIKLHELAPLPAPVLTEAQQSRVSLGKELFNDPILSRDHSVSCASCHESRFVFSDARQKAIGIDRQVGLRNTPALFNLNLWQSFFWDGRAKTLQQQVIMPISDHLEMDLSVTDAVERLAKHPGYQAKFAALYPGQPLQEIQLAEVLTAFSLTLSAPKTRFDDFIQMAYRQDKDQQGMATQHLRDDELLGLHLFRTKARCLNCHNGAFFSDNEFHVTGFHFFGRQLEDLGRYRFTGNTDDSGKFRTPSLRAISKTGPWMHNGNMQNLRGVMAFYNVGGPQPKKPAKHPNLHLWPQHSPLLKNLALSRQEMDAVVAFMNIL